MVAQLLGLKLRLLANMLRRSPWQIFGMVIGFVYGAGIAFVTVAALVGARFVTQLGLVHSVTTVVGAAVFLGFLLLPLVFGVDDTMDPRRFSLYGIPTTRLSFGLALAALIGVPSLVLAVAAASSVVTWSRDPATTVLALICAAVLVASFVLGSRVTTSIAAFVFATRRSRDIGGVVGLLLVVLFAPLVVLLLSINWARDGIAVLASIASWLGWTPLGAVVSAPGRAAQGEWGAAILQLLIALASLGALWLGWRALVGWMLVTPQREAEARSYSGLGWFSRLPGAVGAIAARSITYWGRDVRYWVSLILIPVVPLLMVFALLIAGMPPHFVTLLPLPVMCLFLGWSVHNDVAYDGTAVWLHIASGTRGASDRIGRLFPVLLLGVPLVVIGSVVTAFAYGSVSILLAMIGVSSAVLLVGIGFSSVSSALFPYPATRPGQSAFTQPQSSGGFAALVQSVSFFAIVLVVSPVIVFLVLGIVLDPLWLGWALVAGVSIGVAALVGGVWLGGWIFERRAPQLMAFAVRNG